VQKFEERFSYNLPGQNFVSPMTSGNKSRKHQFSDGYIHGKLQFTKKHFSCEQIISIMQTFSTGC